MAKGREAFFGRVASSLIIPITFLPLAAVMLAIGTQLGIAPVEAAGLALIRNWLPLFYGIGLSVGFAEADGMAALSVAAGFLVMVSVAESVSGDPTLNVGVLGGLIAGAVSTWLFQRVKQVRLPEYLALFSGKRMGPIVAAAAGVPLGYGFGYAWPGIHAGIVALGNWIHGSGAIGAFVYGAALRLLIPTGLHHILMQLIDTQVGGFVDPMSGKLVAGEYLRFLAGDPTAGAILSGFFITLGFAPVGAGLAIIHEARSEQRRKVAGMMTTGMLTAALLGVTEPVEFAYIFASPVLFGLHAVLSGFASLIAYMLGIRAGGYALPMILINWHQSARVWLLIPLGLAYIALYYVSFRAVIRWLRPPILGQTDEATVAEGPTEEGEGPAYLAALGGAANLVSLEACMTRLRLAVRSPEAVDDQALHRLGAANVLRPGGGAVQVVVGTRAGELAEQIRVAAGARLKAARTESAPAALGGGTGVGPAQPGAVVTLRSPLTGRVLALEDVPDPVFSAHMAGEGIAIEPVEGRLVSPVGGRVLHVFPGGHAVGIATPEGLEVLVHVGIDTVSLKGEGFAVSVKEGDQVHPGTELGRFDLAVLAAHGKVTVTPVLVTNPDRVEAIVPLCGDTVRAGEPLLRVELKA